VKVLLISNDPAVRDVMALCVRSLERHGEERVQFLEARDGLQGIRMAWREWPDAVVADEMASRAGAFAVAKDLKEATEPFPGRVIILLDRVQDEWLARWSGADAWFVKPVNPFELADAVTGLLGIPNEEAV
jgi:DNA-binding response OmpR family regulator